MSRFKGKLEVEIVKDDAKGLFRLLKPLVFESDSKGLVIRVPKGYVTDFASVPLLFRNIVGEQARKSGTVHDYLYGSHELQRYICDGLLYEMLVTEKVPKYQAFLYWLMVRAFGWIFFHNLTRNKARIKYK